MKSESDIVADYLEFLIANWTPSERFQGRTHVTPAQLMFGKAMVTAAASQIRSGKHLEWQEMQQKKQKKGKAK